MSKQMKLSQRGYIFGLGAFRRYKEITGHDIGHFEEALFKMNEIGLIEASYRWGIMLKCANDVYVNINGGDQYSVDEFVEFLNNEADQEESNKLVQQYLDSTLLGNPIRHYYGVPKIEEGAKKKNTQRVKPTSKP